MTLFLQQLADGLALGAVYASLAFALVLVFRGTGVVNLAQGELATLTTYIGWTFISIGIPAFLAIVITLPVAMLLGCGLYLTVMRPLRNRSPFTQLIMMIATFYALNSLSGLIWGLQVREVPSPFGQGVLRVNSVELSNSSLGAIALLVVLMLAITWFFRTTRAGLSLRATASNAVGAVVVGISTDRTALLSWGLAAVMGAVSGFLVAPQVFLEPSMMVSVLLYAVAAATLGGYDSLPGAMVGGIIVGVTQNLAGAYVGFLGDELELVVPVAIIVGVLLVRPYGLFGTQVLERA